MRDVLGVLLQFVAWWVPVVYFAGAAFITHRVAGNNPRARDWMIGLFAVVFVLLMALLIGWPSLVDDA
ncbi:hypothetical protein MPL1032_190131 [Mesorhizobium plurifarium]|uniref:Transmembrane protein n=1 Tax=Mesorhizobium plurifarium TaxID=69974 RepID=A0A0K2VVK7_MESPL|nr:hypothetical protein MPL1032_190131 [Mesorhizobium plurifarium]